MEKENIVTRENLLHEAVYRCYKEMYANAQPPEDYDKLLELAKAGKEDEKDPFYTHHYLSHDECIAIIDKYVDAYGLDSKFNDHCETILHYFDEGIVDKYIKEDDNPGHKGYEHLKPLKELIGEDAYNIVVERVNQAMQFYRFDRDKNTFTFTVALGCSPTSNKETVINYWKSKGVDLEIKDRSEDDIYWRYYEGVTEYEDED